MTDEIVSHETAKLALKKGFIDRQHTFYHDGYLYDDHIVRTASGEVIEAPTQSLLQRWLREEHKIHIQPTKQFHNKGYKLGKIPIGESSYNGPHNKKYNTYEEALEEGLKYALNLLIK